MAISRVVPPPRGRRSLGSRGCHRGREFLTKLGQKLNRVPGGLVLVRRGRHENPRHFEPNRLIGDSAQEISGYLGLMSRNPRDAGLLEFSLTGILHCQYSPPF